MSEKKAVSCQPSAVSKNKAASSDELRTASERLPDSWACCDLDTLLDYVTSGSRDWSKYYSNEGVNFIRTQDIKTNSLDLSNVAKVQLPDKVEGKRTLVKENDLLITITGANVGKCARINKKIPESYVSQSVALVRLMNPKLTDFIHKQIMAPVGEKTALQQAAYGMGRPVLNLSNIREFNVKLPPLAEQKVIAEKLDTLLAQVDNIKTRLDAIPNIIKRFRQSVLSAAVSGKLTEEWRVDNEVFVNVPTLGSEKFKQSLFESARETLPDLPRTWAIVPAANTLEYVTSGSRGWAKYYSDHGALFLRMSNVRYDTTKLDLQDLQFVNLPSTVEGKRSLVKREDLIVSITADVGRVARIDRDLSEAYINQHLALVRPTSEIDSEFLATCITALEVGVKQVNTLKRGATKAGLGLDDIRSLAIPFPPLEEQTEIVNRVEKLFAFADQIEKQVSNAQQRVNNLTQSILAKAFRGELTAGWREQNPDLISGENSAETLLKKIKAEREKLNPAKKVRMKK